MDNADFGFEMQRTVIFVENHDYKAYQKVQRTVIFVGNHDYKICRKVQRTVIFIIHGHFTIYNCRNIGKQVQKVAGYGALHL